MVNCQHLVYVCNAPALNGHKWRSCVIEEKIASVFVGRFRCGLQLFFGEEKPFPRIKQNWKLSLGGATIGAPMREKIFKIRKLEQSLCAPLRPFRSELKENVYHSIVPHVLWMCIRIKIFHYFVTGCHKKLSSSYRWYQKRTVGPTFVRTESLLNRAILRNVLEDFYSGWYVVVHPCSDFFLRCQMAPRQSINFKSRIFRLSVHLLLWFSEQRV